MSTERFDTSGYVQWKGGYPFGHRNFLEWSDLNPFTQGYVEAMLTPMMYIGECSQGSAYEHMRFSDLAPETLARIMEDCTAFLGHPDNSMRHYAASGRGLWSSRQAGTRPDFPPLTPYLGDAGKVYLRNAK